MTIRIPHALALLAAAASLALAAAAPARADTQADARVDAGLRDAALRYVPDQLIVQFRRGPAPAARETALAGLGMQTIKLLRSELKSTDGRGDLQLVRLPAGKKVAEAIAALRRSDLVEFAEPNWLQRTAAKGVDPYYADGRLWGVYGEASPQQVNEFGSGAATAYAQGRRCSASVLVGIIDEGVMPDHPDTAANVWTNPFEIAGNGIDDDGNGYVDDVHGWDFMHDDASTFDGRVDDHATHVSGTIGAVANNATGVAGVCPKVQMISAKFLEGSGDTADAVRAVDYITDLKTRHGLNIVATNNSWGGGGFSQALQDAITRAGQAEILFIAAAGNGNFFGRAQDTDKKPHYPSSLPNANIISVAAITKTGAKASFSNYGLTTVDIGAPGVDIISTIPVTQGGAVVGGYGSMDGTSMATPHVTGAVALYASLHPGASAAQIKTAILASAKPTASLAGKTVTGGRLDVSGF